MMKKTPAVSDGHAIPHLVDDLVIEFKYEAFQDYINEPATHLGVSKTVKVKAFRVYVTETWTRGGHQIYSKTYNCIVSSRANDIAVLFREFKKCKTCDEMAVRFKKAIRDFRVSIKKDALHKLKSMLGAGSKTLTPDPIEKFKRKRTRRPIPEIELPWEKHKK